MTRPIILGNGNMLVCLDKHARIRDFYYPFIGQENHVSSNRHRIGVWIEGGFSWVSADDWELEINYRHDTLVSEIRAYSHKLQIELLMNDAVYYDKTIFLRHMRVINRGRKKREVKVFFGQHFQISESIIGDTVYYNPILESVINYKGRRYFLIGGTADGKNFDDYATGNSYGTNQGTWIDAEDGILSKNSIEHGSVDSTIGFTLNLEKDEEKEIHYWIAVGKTHSEVRSLREFVLKHGLNELIEKTADYWINWLNKKPVDFCDLDSKVIDLFRRSLLIVRAQTDNRGAIIAANDTHTFHYKKDTYSYMWPRDGALIARSLDRVGHHSITNTFFKFCSGVVSEDGYLFHKYRPDGSLGSSWHSWLNGDKLQLPIQEDETGLILDALWKHYLERKEDDGNFIKNMYRSFIKKAGDFLVEFRDSETNLPKESYDLWEEKLGVHTFTCSTVYAGLEAAKNFANVFGTKKNVLKYGKAAAEVRNAINKYLYCEEEKRFIKGIYYDSKNQIQKDKTIDVSTAYALFEYKVVNIYDPRLTATMDKTIEKLWCKTGAGGLGRYEGDVYYEISRDAPENPWFIPTMWLAEYYIAKAKNLEELKLAENLFFWAVEKSLKSGVLSEQINPYTGETLSVAPLTWSHAGFIIAVLKYLERYEKLKNCPKN